MEAVIVKYKDWEFEVNKELTERTYRDVHSGGAETCLCAYCKTYLLNRDKILLDDSIALLKELGIDYTKDVEIVPYDTAQTKIVQFGGWFHFKGKILKRGVEHRISLPGGGYTFDLDNFAETLLISFSEKSDMAFFDEKSDLVQVDFFSKESWLIDDI